MSADRYPGIFSRQMETIAYLFVFALPSTAKSTATKCQREQNEIAKDTWI